MPMYGAVAERFGLQLRSCAWLCLLALLAACSPSGGDGDRELDDPAMATPAPTAAVPSDDPVQPPTPQEPETLRLSDDGERIFVPGMGWVQARGFWRMYEHQPERLPAGLDYSLLHRLKEEFDERG